MTLMEFFFFKGMWPKLALNSQSFFFGMYWDYRCVLPTCTTMYDMIYIHMYVYDSYFFQEIINLCRYGPCFTPIGFLESSTVAPV
jgi:hypothetical protein